MSYSIDKQIIAGLPKKAYRNGVAKPEGVVLHETGTYGGTALGNHNYEARTFNTAFVHYFVDWSTIIQNADTDYVAYGAGPKANARFVHVELVRTKDSKQFEESYKRYVFIIVQILKKYHLKPERKVTLWTHHDVTQILGGTTHTDPDAYLASQGKSVDDLIKDITAQYNAKPAGAATTSSKPASTSGTIYRVRKSADDVKSQLGAFKDKQAALDLAKKHPGFEVYDQAGKQVSAGGTITSVSIKAQKPIKTSKPTTSSKASVPYPGQVLKKGSKGKDVERIQRALGITVDGVFGVKTETAVMAYQKRHGLTIDGVIGQQTWNVLF